MTRHPSKLFALSGLSTHAGERMVRIIQERPILALTGAAALGFITGAAFAKRDGHLFIGAARIVLGWVAANLDA